MIIHTRTPKVVPQVAQVRVVFGDAAVEQPIGCCDFGFCREHSQSQPVINRNSRRISEERYLSDRAFDIWLTVLVAAV